MRPAAEQALEAGRVARVAADRLAALLKMTTRPGPQADALAAAGLSGSEAAEALRALLPLGKALEQLAGVVQE
ncbi:MAG: hypothetical protein J0L61_13685 [Planctomycetes bacterium]|nr:hypothetical protein [Planctomycetota bacterium]